jgi:GrpB-like predicted nucleotidyltransferase (UPF0157 family)
MLLPIPVVIVEHDLQWTVKAARFSCDLRALSSVVLDVHHIGSTSVLGLAAKPIIDLMPTVSNLTKFDELQLRVEALGYVYHGEFGMAGRRYCTLSNGAGNRLVQLHCFEENSPHIQRHLAFRDYLRAHPAVAKRYENEKHRAALLHADNSHAYSDEKSAWIRSVELDALAWYVKQRCIS